MEEGGECARSSRDWKQEHFHFIRSVLRNSTKVDGEMNVVTSDSRRSMNCLLVWLLFPQLEEDMDMVILPHITEVSLENMLDSFLGVTRMTACRSKDFVVSQKKEDASEVATDSGTNVKIKSSLFDVVEHLNDKDDLSSQNGRGNGLHVQHMKLKTVESAELSLSRPSLFTTGVCAEYDSPLPLCEEHPASPASTSAASDGTNDLVPVVQEKPFHFVGEESMQSFQPYSDSVASEGQPLQKNDTTEPTEPDIFFPNGPDLESQSEVTTNSQILLTVDEQADHLYSNLNGDIRVAEDRLTAPDETDVSDDQRIMETHKPRESDSLEDASEKSIFIKVVRQLQEIIAEDRRCQGCGADFFSEKECKKHARVCHGGVRPEDVIFDCHLCDKIFRTRSSLVAHIKTHQKGRLFICDVCGAGHRSRDSLRLHVAENHVAEDKLRSFSCQHCQKHFRFPAQLKLHERSHTKEKPFTCDICHKKFSLKYNLKQHKITHMPAKDLPHKCHMCGHGATSASLLRLHVLSHTSDKMFSCSKCGNAYRWRSSLQRHKASRCSNSFNALQALSENWSKTDIHPKKLDIVPLKSITASKLEGYAPDQDDRMEIEAIRGQPQTVEQRRANLIETKIMEDLLELE